MTWDVGALVVIDDDGVVTAGGGARLALFNARVNPTPPGETEVAPPTYLDSGVVPADWAEAPVGPNYYDSWYSYVEGWPGGPSPNHPPPYGSKEVIHPAAVGANDSAKTSWVKRLRSMAKECNNMADGIVAYAKAQAAVTVTIATTDSGLQRLPADISEDEPTKGPAANKFIYGVIT